MRGRVVEARGTKKACETHARRKERSAIALEALDMAGLYISNGSSEKKSVRVCNKMVVLVW